MIYLPESDSGCRCGRSGFPLGPLFSSLSDELERAPHGLRWCSSIVSCNYNKS